MENDADQKRVAEYIMHSKGKAKPSRSQTLDVVGNVQNSNTIDFINKWSLKIYSILDIFCMSWYCVEFLSSYNSFFIAEDQTCVFVCTQG